MTKTVSLETAKLLKEAGWPQDEKTDYHWYQQVGGIVVDTDVRGQWIIRPKKELALGFGDCVAAPDTTELLEALPRSLEFELPDDYPRYADFKDGKAPYELRMESYCAPKWRFGYYYTDNKHGGCKHLACRYSFCAISREGATPAEALAALWLELRKQKIV